MKSVSIAGVTKAFGGPPVLSGVDLDVPGGSFTAILGSSGSGKTTLLRIIAGFERPDAGEVRLGAEVVDDGGHQFVPCERRLIGYVPQEGALFPHLSVGRNVAFGLDRGARRGSRVDELLELVGLVGMGRRYPHQLSGGQQQRVALARALAPGPEIVLLDEPFSSLDASLRASVRADVHGVLRLSGATSILVTHDQDEALSMADQVAVLRGGVIAQINTPSSLYRLPRDAELAQFLGEANLVEGTVNGKTVQTPLGELEMTPAVGPEPGPERGRVRVMVRPEQLVLGEAGTAGVSSVVRSYEYFGHDAVVRVQPDNAGLPELVVRITGGTPFVPGARVEVSVQGAVMAWPEDDQGARFDRSGALAGANHARVTTSLCSLLRYHVRRGESTGGAMAEVPTTEVGGFHGPQVCGLVGITYRQLDYWARTGLLQPSVTAARGSGTRRVYSYSDVLELKVIKQLLDAGVSLQSARRAVECLRQDLGADVASSNLVLTGTSSVLARSNGEVVDLLAGGQGVFNIVPLAGVVDELEADIVRLDIAAQSRPSGERPASVEVARAAGE